VYKCVKPISLSAPDAGQTNRRKGKQRYKSSLSSTQPPSSRHQQYLSVVAHMNWTPCGSRLNLLWTSQQSGALEVQCAGPLPLTNPIPSYGSNSKLKTDALGQEFLAPNHGAMQIIAMTVVKRTQRRRSTLQTWVTACLVVHYARFTDYQIGRTRLESFRSGPDNARRLIHYSCECMLPSVML
jgi:hypothetical protein